MRIEVKPRHSQDIGEEQFGIQAGRGQPCGGQPIFRPSQDLAD
jgi:hypothetical protein